MKEEILKIINELITEYEPNAIPQTYDDYSEGAEALRRLREKVSQIDCRVKPANAVNNIIDQMFNELELKIRNNKRQSDVDDYFLGGLLAQKLILKELERRLSV